MIFQMWVTVLNFVALAFSDSRWYEREGLWHLELFRSNIDDELNSTIQLFLDAHIRSRVTIGKIPSVVKFALATGLSFQTDVNHPKSRSCGTYRLKEISFDSWFMRGKKSTRTNITQQNSLVSTRTVRCIIHFWMWVWIQGRLFYFLLSGSSVNECAGLATDKIRNRNVLKNLLVFVQLEVFRAIIMPTALGVCLLDLTRLSGPTFKLQIKDKYEYIMTGDSAAQTFKINSHNLGVGSCVVVEVNDIIVVNECIRASDSRESLLLDYNPRPRGSDSLLFKSESHFLRHSITHFFPLVLVVDSVRDFSSRACMIGCALIMGMFKEINTQRCVESSVRAMHMIMSSYENELVRSSYLQLFILPARLCFLTWADLIEAQENFSNFELFKFIGLLFRIFEPYTLSSRQGGIWFLVFLVGYSHSPVGTHSVGYIPTIILFSMVLSSRKELYLRITYILYVQGYFQMGCEMNGVPSAIVDRLILMDTTTLGVAMLDMTLFGRAKISNSSMLLVCNLNSLEKWSAVLLLTRIRQ
ncbi:hypothetical protein C8Q75DRAFT_735828 [Abortiporus biennis]|nr:hypothetical protein C8Q75DRAFT_735828 [Abortiporus biennis]